MFTEAAWEHGDEVLKQSTWQGSDTKLWAQLSKALLCQQKNSLAEWLSDSFPGLQNANIKTKVIWTSSIFKKWMKLNLKESDTARCQIFCLRISLYQEIH